MSETRSLTRNLMFGVYSGAIATVTAVVGHKLVTTLWTTVTVAIAPE